MNNDKLNNANLTPAQVVKGDWKAFVDKVSHKGLVGNMPFLAFLAFICLLYISNNHLALRLQRSINAKHKLLKELRWKNMDIRSQLMSKQMESQMIKDVATIGLRPIQKPTLRLTIDTNKN